MAPPRWPAPPTRTPATASSSSASTMPPSSTSQYTVWGKVTEGMENVDKIKRGEPMCRTRTDRQGADGCRRRLKPHTLSFRGDAISGQKISRSRVRCCRIAPGQRCERPMRNRPSSISNSPPKASRCRRRARAIPRRCWWCIADGVLRDRRHRRPARIGSGWRSDRRQRHQGDRGAAEGPPHRARDRAEDRGDADQARSTARAGRRW